MLQAERERSILSLLQEQGTVTVRELSERFDVTEVTIRRDLQKLEADALLRRTHGGAMTLDMAPTNGIPTDDQAPDIDALIISPVNNRAAHTLREKAIRHQIPLISESTVTEHAHYLGPRNYEAGYELGQWTRQYLLAHQHNTPVVLDITQHGLANTAERSRGFAAGLGSDIERLSIDGQALYDRAYGVATNALLAHPEINVIFGINDDSLLAGLQAYHDLGYTPDRLLAVNIGGEGDTIFDMLAQNGPFKACVALFPELVGQMGIDAIARLWANQPIGDTIFTPHQLLTAGTVHNVYHRNQDHWLLRDDAAAQLSPTLSAPAPPKHKTVSFVIHYRTHEWYQSVSRAMARRADELGIEFKVQDLQEDLAAEVKNLRRLIGKVAASYINPGETIILDAGSTTAYMTQFFRDQTPFTVLTNSLAVQARLARHQHINLLLTGGEYDPKADALVGRGAHLFLQEVRADKVFIVAGGVSQSFGVSSVDLREAEVRQHMIQSAKEVVILADHTVLGVDASIKVCDLSEVDTVITDSGIQADQRLMLSRLGIEVIVAGAVDGSHSKRR